MFDVNIIRRCAQIAGSLFLNTPYTNNSYFGSSERNLVNKDYGICHYCSISTLNQILTNECLRFTDVRFLNDSTELLEIIDLIHRTLKKEDYNKSFKDFLLNSSEMKELEEYKHLYKGVMFDDGEFKNVTYHTYTCSFSTNNDSISMWQYYADTASGVNVSFDVAGNIFPCKKLNYVNSMETLDNGIKMYRGIVLYKDNYKMECIKKLLDELYNVFKDFQNEIGIFKRYILHAFRESVYNIRCFFKNENFICEDEYRFVIKIPENLLRNAKECDSIYKTGVFQRGNILIPYVDYKFQKESIQSINMNPAIKEKNSIFELGIRHLLWLKQLEKVDIFPSSIPIRKYS